MQVESLIKKMRKEAAGLKALESTNDVPMKDATTAAPAPVPVPAPPQPLPKSSAPVPPPSSSSSVTYTSIDKFAFDAGSYGEKFVTIYVTLPNVGSIEDKENNVTCKFTKDEFDLCVMNLNGKNYRLKKDNLEHDIVPEKSKYIVKADKVVIKLQKVKGEYGSYDYWSKLTDPKRKSKEKKDPAASITDLMKEMYENGDDQMRKMIGETMLKQRNGELNKGAGGMGLGDLDDM
jgi:calcyclin binding protein